MTSWERTILLVILLSYAAIMTIAIVLGREDED